MSYASLDLCQCNGAPSGHYGMVETLESMRSSGTLSDLPDAHMSFQGGVNSSCTLDIEPPCRTFRPVFAVHIPPPLLLQRMPTKTGKRPSIEAIPAASSSSSTLQLQHQSQALPLYPLFASLVFHIVPAKLENDLGVVYQSIEDLGGRCDGIESARWIVSALRGRARLSRVLGKWMVSCSSPKQG